MSETKKRVNYILENKIKDSKEVLKLAAEMSGEYYQKPLIITYSGGKDSDVLLQLAIESLSPDDFEVLNSHTTVDAPETVYYIRERFEKLEKMGIKTTVQYPHYKDGTPKTMWNLIVKKQMPPTRLARYCCAELKETSTPNRFIAVGVREAESTARRGRDTFASRGATKKEALYYTTEHVREVFEDDKARRREGGVGANEEGVWDCSYITRAKKNQDLICNPIYKWTDSEVWQFINDRKMKYNPLYDKGFTRVGCIGCPLNSNQKIELERYPKYKRNYINAFQRMVDALKEKNKSILLKYNGKWSDGEAVYRWWVQDDTIEGQMDIFDYIEKGEDI